MARPRINTLSYDPSLCNDCGMCATVCPHGVFENGDRKVHLVRQEECMECGACSLNCTAGAIKVDSDVGCATAMMVSALLGRGQASCGCA